MDSHEKVEYSYSYTYKDKKFSKLSQNLLIYILEFNNKNDCWKISRIKNQKLTKALIQKILRFRIFIRIQQSYNSIK